MSYDYVPDGPLENMRIHALKELAEWKRAEARNQEFLDSAIRMIAHWGRSLEEIDTERARRTKETQRD